MDVAAGARSTRYAFDPVRQRACERIWPTRRELDQVSYHWYAAAGSQAGLPPCSLSAHTLQVSQRCLLARQTGQHSVDSGHLVGD